MIIFVEDEDLKIYPALRSEIVKLRANGLKAMVDPSLLESADDLDLVLDALDTMMPAYFLCLSDETGEVLGALRVLQTMGPHTLSYLVPEISQDDFPMRSPHLWELSRLCLAESVSDGSSEYSAERVTGELLIGSQELGLQSGITDFVLVLSARGEALVSSLQVPFFGEAGRTLIEKWGLEVSAQFMECSTGNLEILRRHNDLKGATWADKRILSAFAGDEGHDRTAHKEDLFTEIAKADRPDDIRQRLQLFCAQEILDARTLKDRREALSMMRALTRILHERNPRGRGRAA